MKSLVLICSLLSIASLAVNAAYPALAWSRLASESFGVKEDTTQVSNESVSALIREIKSLDEAP